MNTLSILAKMSSSFFALILKSILTRWHIKKLKGLAGRLILVRVQDPPCPPKHVCSKESPVQRLALPPGSCQWVIYVHQPSRPKSPHVLNHREKNLGEDGDRNPDSWPPGTGPFTGSTSTFQFSGSIRTRWQPQNSYIDLWSGMCQYPKPKLLLNRTTPGRRCRSSCPCCPAWSSPSWHTGWGGR